MRNPTKKRISVYAIVCFLFTSATLLTFLFNFKASAAASMTVGKDSVKFSIEYNDTNEAFIAGSFNFWQLEPLKKENGKWVSETIKLKPGFYEYKYVVKISDKEMRWMDCNYKVNTPNSNFYVGNVVSAAFMDIEYQNSEKLFAVNAVLPPSNTAGTQYKVFENGNELASGTSSAESNKIKILLPKNTTIHPDSTYEIKDAAGKLDTAVITLRTALNDFSYQNDDLGVTFSGDKVTFKVWSPTSTDMKLDIYEKNTDNKQTPKEELQMKKNPATGVWSFDANKSNVENKFYLYKATFHGAKIDGFKEPNYAVDPYATAVGNNGTKGAVVNIKEIPSDGAKTDLCPEKWNSDNFLDVANNESTILYETHVKDFSLDPNSVSSDPSLSSNDPNKGRYLAFTECADNNNGTHLKENSNIKTGLDHLQELGVNAIHLLPSYDFGTVNESKFLPPDRLSEATDTLFSKDKDNSYNWGYDPMNYNVPEGSYSSDPSNPKARILEFREMVKALHSRNIRVILDVVYNHVYDADSSNFNALVPMYFFRTDEYGQYLNGSGCFNDVATERVMVRKFIADSSRQWVDNYHVDGFRFDLLGLYDKDTVADVETKLKAQNKSVLIYGEPWALSAPPLPVDKLLGKGSQRSQGYAIFNDIFRNAIRGENIMEEAPKAFVTDWAASKPLILEGIKGGVFGFHTDTENNDPNHPNNSHEGTDDPEETINYVSCHDDYNLFDQIQSAMKRLSRTTPSDRWEVNDSDRKRDILASGIILTSQGIPFIQAGDEFLRTKNGVYNTHDASESLNMMRWTGKKNNNSVFNYYKGLIELRRQHPAFCMTNKNQIDSYFEELNAPEDMIAYKLNNNANNDSWKTIVVIINPYLENKQVGLPEGKYTAVVDSVNAGINPLWECNNRVDIPGLSMMVLYQNS